MKVIQLTNELPDKEVDKLGGTHLKEDSYDTVLDEDAIVYKPNGDILCVLKRNAIPKDVCDIARINLRKAATETNNRGLAGGELDLDKISHGRRNQPVGEKSRFRYKPILKDGTKSKTMYSNPVNSGIIGYYDRYPRIPYCRLTAFNLHHPEKFARIVPYIRYVNEVFREYAPERYKAQEAIIKKTSKDFYVKDTVFTTITVNKNWQTAVHKDAGDFEKGIGVMACLRKGEYTGGYTTFPKYRVAVNLQHGDVLLADVHEWHGNTPLKGKTGRYERISCIFYYREKMQECGTATEELERAKRFSHGQL